MQNASFTPSKHLVSTRHRVQTSLGPPADHRSFCTMISFHPSYTSLYYILSPFRSSYCCFLLYFIYPSRCAFCCLLQRSSRLRARSLIHRGLHPAMFHVYRCICQSSPEPSMLRGNISNWMTVRKLREKFSSPLTMIAGTKEETLKDPDRPFGDRVTLGIERCWGYNQAPPPNDSCLQPP